MSTKNNKTRVDDMIMEMISPKITEIEERFSRGEGLSQDDINTLLLKPQHNHINHLDDKLNEVTKSVTGLEGRFVGLEGNFDVLEQKFDTLEQKVEKIIEKALNKNSAFYISIPFQNCVPSSVIFI